MGLKMAQRFVLTAQLQLQAPTNVRSVVGQIRKQLKGINVNVGVNTNTRQLAQVNKQFQTVSKSAKGAARETKQLGTSIAQAARRFSVLTVATGSLLALTRGLKNATKEAIEFERELVKISQVTGKSVGSLKGLTVEVTALATTFGVSSKEILTAARTLAQAGFSAEKAQKALKILTQTNLAATFNNIADTTEGAIALLNQFRKEAAQTGGEIAFLERSLGAINSVSKKFAVESKDLISVIRRTGGVFEAAGGSINELIALFTSVRSTTRETADTIATGFRTIFTRIQRVETMEQLRKFGIVLQDLEGKFVGPMEAVKRLSIALSTLDPRDFRFNMIVEQLGGFRQIGKVIPLIKQFSVAQEALKVAQSGSGSIARDAATAQQSLAVQIQKVREEFSALIRKFADSETFRTLAHGALEVARAFIRIADSLEPLLPMLTALFAMRIGKGLAPALGAISGVKKFAAGGLVPGSGNRDTVPAMLTPGEFVIRKSSVNKLGASNLAAMNKNKYAFGGRARNFGAIALLPMDEKKSAPGKISLKDIRGALALKGKGKKFLRKEENQSIANAHIRRVLGETGNTVKTTATGESFSKSDVAASIDNLVKKSMGKLIDNSARKLSKQTGISVAGKADDRILRKVGTASTVGSIFEGALNLLGAPMVQGAEQAAFDFPKGVGSKLADKEFPNFKDKPTDAKRTINAKVLKEVAGKKAKNYLSDMVFRDPVYRRAITTGGLKKEQLDALQKGATLDRMKETFSGKNFEETQKNARRAGYEITKEGSKYTLAERKGAALRAAGKGYGRRGMNAGGQVDTVPAMLTPGEFVIKKSSAQAIGYGKLNTMNKVGHYADGGIVQHFGNGTSGTGVQPLKGGLEGTGPSFHGFLGGILEVQKESKKAGITIGNTSKDVALLAKVVQDTGVATKNTKANMRAAKDTVGKQTFAAGGDLPPSWLSGAPATGAAPLRQQVGHTKGASVSGDTAVKVEKQLLSMGANTKAAASGLLQYRVAIKKGLGPQDAFNKAAKQASSVMTRSANQHRRNIQILVEAGNERKSLTQKLKAAGASAGKGLMGMPGRMVGGIGSGLKGMKANRAARRQAGGGGGMGGMGGMGMMMLAPVVGSLVNEMSGLEDATKNQINQTIAFGSTLAFTLPMVKQMGEAAGLGQKGLGKLSGVLLGVGAGLTAMQYVVSGFNESAKAAQKKQQEALGQVGKGGGTPELQKQMQEMGKLAAANSARAENAKTAGIGGALAGAAAGALIGSVVRVLGTAVGAAVGGVIGGVAGGFGGAHAGAAMTEVSDDEQAAMASANAQFLAADAAYQLAHSFDMIEKKNMGVLKSTQATIAATNQFNKQMAKAEQEARMFEGLTGDDLTSEQKDQKKNVQTQLEKGREQSVAAQGKLRGAAQAQMRSMIDAKKGTESFTGMMGRSNKETKTTRDALEAYRQQVIKNKSEAAGIDSVERTAIEEAQAVGVETEAGQGILKRAGIDEGELRSYNNAVGEANELYNGLIAEGKAYAATQRRNREIMDAQTRAAKSNLAVQNQLRRGNMALSRMSQAQARFGEERGTSVSRTSGVAAQLDFGNAMADMQGFSSAVGHATSTMGKEGKVRGKQVVAQATVLKQMEAMGDSQVTLDKDAPGQIDRLLQENLGISVDTVGADFYNEIRNRIEEQVQAGEAINFTEIFQGMEPAVQREIKTIQDMAKQQDQIRKQYAASWNQLFSIMDREANLRKGMIEIQARGEGRVAKAQGRTISRQRKEATRGASRQVDLQAGGLGGVRSIAQLGGALRASEQKKRRNDALLGSGTLLGEGKRTEVEEENRNLARQAKTAANVLEQLANQSERAADTMSDLEAAQQKRLAVQETVKEFAFASDQGRQEMAQQFGLLQRVLQTGSLASIPDDMRGVVGGLLDKFSDIELAPGMTGADVSKELQIQELDKLIRMQTGGRQGISNQQIRQIFEASTEEEKLTNELRAISQQEMAAQAQLLQAEIQQKEAAWAMVDAMRNLAAVLQNQGTPVAAVAQAHGGPVYASKGASIFKPRGTDTVPAMLTPGEFVIRKSAVDKIGVGNLAALNAGGPIYRAAGGPVNVMDPEMAVRMYFSKMSTLQPAGLKSVLGKAGWGSGKDGGVKDPVSGKKISAIQWYFKQLKKGDTDSILKKDPAAQQILKTANALNAHASVFANASGRSVKIADNADPQRVKSLSNSVAVLLKGAMTNHSVSSPLLAVLPQYFSQLTGIIQAVRSFIDFKTGGTSFNRPTDFQAAPEGKGIESREASTVKMLSGQGVSVYERDKKGQLGGVQGQVGVNKFTGKMGGAQGGRATTDKRLKQLYGIAYGGRGGAHGLAAGGSVDSVPAMLTPGEFVMSKGAVNRHGVGFMKQLNRGKIRGFNKGGPVYRERGGGIFGRGRGGGMMGVDATSLAAAFATFTQGVDKVVPIFGNLIYSLDALAAAWSSMTMTHQVNVNGQLNIGGINDQQLVAAIQEGIGSFVAGEVIKGLNNDQKNYKV